MKVHPQLAQHQLVRTLAGEGADGEAIVAHLLIQVMQQALDVAHLQWQPTSWVDCGCSLCGRQACCGSSSMRAQTGLQVGLAWALYTSRACFV